MIDAHPESASRQFTLEEIILSQRNHFFDLLVAHLLDLKRHKVIFKENPKYTKVIQGGQQIPIRALIDSYIQGIKNAQAYIDILDALKRDGFEKTCKDAIVPLPPEEKKPEVANGVPTTGAKPTSADSADQEEGEEEDEALGTTEKKPEVPVA